MERDVKVIESSTIASDVVAIASQAIENPETTLVIIPPRASRAARAQDTPGAVVASAHFLTTLRYVAIGTAILLVVWVAVAFFLPEPTATC